MTATHTKDIPEWLVSAKVQPPRTGSETLSRFSPFHDSKLHFITHIEAPAGYGKTTLLNQHYEAWTAHEGATALWLTFSADETGRSFVEYLAYALIRNGNRLSADFFDELPENVTLTKHLNILANTFEHEAGKWLLIFDDLEVVNEDVCAALEHLISIAPPNVHFLIAGRMNPGLSLSHFAMQGQLLHVRADELAFTAHHILALFGDRISLEDAARIQEATLGWPMAVQLVRMDMKAGCPLEESLKRLGDPSEIASQYIREQIDGRLTDTIRTTLLEASVLDWLEADALRATQGTDNLLTRLNDLGEIGYLISPIGDGPDTYRIHPLLREFLRDSLRRQDPEKYRALHRATAVWMAQKNRFRLALSHAYQSEDEDLIGTLIEDFGGVRLFIQEGVSRAFSSQVYLNDYILQAFPRVALMHCVIQTKRGLLTEARDVYTKIAKHTKGFKIDRPGGTDGVLEMDHHISLPFMVLYGALPDEYLNQNDLYHMPEGTGMSALVDGAYNNSLCVSNFVTGELDEASRRADLARRWFEEASSVYGQLYIDLHEGAIAFNIGDQDRAAQLFDAAKAKQRRSFREDEGARLACDVMLAELRLFQGDLDSVGRIAPGLPKRLIAYDAWCDLHATAIATAIDYYLARQQLDEALSLVTSMQHYVDQEQVTSLQPKLKRLELVLQAAKGEDPGPQADAALPDKTAILASPPDTIAWRDLESMTKAHFLLQQYRGKAADLDGLAETVVDVFLKKGLHAPACRTLVTAACSEWVVGNASHALDLLKRGLDLIKSSGGVGPLKQNGPIISDMIASDPATRLIGENLKDWLQEITHEAATPEKPLFSPREMDVLAHLAEGKQDKVIARELGVTEHAVRYHLKNIYAKVHVSGRHEAVAHIRKMKLPLG
ncbi:LuxR C-terminal-related transcriptional regulator [Kordiimonas marina]|uniref:LuxR C-terminal-related transcriptional regulator n=1 Tax=Kordiimonas marina TaxID=2872312 RepID=UPI001FF40BFC|nr:LuxR C-terminal-related transcriptional regulator [Kordiimonas marina]MCJ9430616.1 LuxR C-terminal-related transcriptional regulator [Kordiimonas marina]